MSKQVLTGLIMAAVLISVLAASAQAQAPIPPPRMINFQGKLLDYTTQNPITSAVSVTIRIYNVSTGGTALFTEVHPITPNSAGLYSLRIGSIDTSGNPLNLDFQEEYWLSVQVGSDLEMTPRYRLTPSPYAFSAFALEGLTTTVTELNQLSGMSTDVDGTNLSTLTAGVGSNADSLHEHTTTGVTDIASSNAADDLLIGTGTAWNVLAAGAQGEFLQVGATGLAWGSAGSTAGDLLYWDSTNSQWTPLAASATTGDLLASGNPPTWVTPGSGGGLDADTVDTLDSTDFLRANASDNFSGTNTLLIGPLATFNISGTFEISGTAVTSTAADLNLLSGIAGAGNTLWDTGNLASGSNAGDILTWSGGQWQTVANSTTTGDILTATAGGAPAWTPQGNLNFWGSTWTGATTATVGLTLGHTGTGAGDDGLSVTTAGGIAVQGITTADQNAAVFQNNSTALSNVYVVYIDSQGTTEAGLQVNGTTDLLGILDVAGTTTLNGQLTLGSGASPVALIANGTTGTANQVLQSNGTSQPTWVSVNLPPAGTNTGDLLYWNSGTWTVLSNGGVGDLLTGAATATPTWTAQGTGGGLDADDLDGLDSTDYLRSNATNSFTGSNTLRIAALATFNIAGAFQINSVAVTSTAADLNLVSGISGNTLWHSGNDGTGSNLDADDLDGLDSTDFLRATATDTFTTGTLATGAGTTFDIGGTFSIGAAVITSTAADLNMVSGLSANTLWHTGNLAAGGGTVGTVLYWAGAATGYLSTGAPPAAPGGYLLGVSGNAPTWATSIPVGALSAVGQSAGDLVGYNGTNWIRFPRGNNGEVLESTLGGVAWTATPTHAHWGANWTGNNATYGLRLAQSGTGEGLDVSAVGGDAVNASATSGIGVDAQATTGMGLRATATSGYGIYTNSSGTGLAAPVYAVNNNNSGTACYGVYARANSNTSATTCGVYGSANSGRGVMGHSTSTNGAAAGVYGYNSGGGPAAQFSQLGGNTTYAVIISANGATNQGLSLNGTFQCLGAASFSGNVNVPASSLRIASVAVTSSAADLNLLNGLSGNTLWHSGNDGTGSGLDADLLDGISSNGFATAGHGHWGANWTGTGGGTGLYLNNTSSTGYVFETRATAPVAASASNVYGMRSTCIGRANHTGWLGGLRVLVDSYSTGWNNSAGLFIADGNSSGGPGYAGGDFGVYAVGMSVNYGSATTRNVYGVYANAYGDANNAGNTYGVSGWSNGTSAGSNYGGYFSCSGGAPNYAGYFQGETYVMGNFTVNGGFTKSFSMPHSTDPSKEIRYVCAEAPEALVIERGTGTLTNGRCVIDMPEHFLETASEQGIKVQVTPLSETSKGLAVVLKSRERIEIRELMSGSGNYEFDYTVTAKRVGMESFSPITINKHHKPSSFPSIEEYENHFRSNEPGVQEMRRRLISNGVLLPNGTLNRTKVLELGWRLPPETVEKRSQDE